MEFELSGEEGLGGLARDEGSGFALPRVPSACEDVKGGGARTVSRVESGTTTVHKSLNARFLFSSSSHMAPIRWTSKLSLNTRIRAGESHPSGMTRRSLSSAFGGCGKGKRWARDVAGRWVAARW